MESVDMAPKSSDVGQQKASSGKLYTQTQEEGGSDLYV